MENRVLDESITLDNFEFASYLEFKTFVTEEKIVSVGWYWDLFSILVAMRPKEATGSEKADEKYKADRIEATTCELDLAAAMTHSTKPKCLYADAVHDAGFGAFESYSAWMGRGKSSYKVRYTKQLSDYITGVRGNIPNTENGGGLARDLLVQVKSQWGEYIGHIEAFQQELVDEANFTPDTAFTLIGRASNSIWEAMRSPYRVRVAMLPDMATLDNKASYVSPSPPPAHIERDASTILSPKGHCSVYRSAPAELHLVPLRCEPLGRPSAPYFHGGGLLPADVSMRTRVLTPTLFAPAGSWGVRGLTSEEVYSANDWPQFLVDKAADLLLAPPPLLPGKCLHYGFRELMGNGGGNNVVSLVVEGGDRSLLKRKDPVTAVRPVSRPDMGPADQGSSKRLRVESDLMGLRPVEESTSRAGHVPVDESASSAGPAPAIELDAITHEIRERTQQHL
eukprot:scaffold29206_cov30-Attheya_sp.AAC.1